MICNTTRLRKINSSIITRVSQYITEGYHNILQKAMYSVIYNNSWSTRYDCSMMFPQVEPEDNTSLTTPQVSSGPTRGRAHKLLHGDYPKPKYIENVYN